jgi:uncharacterized membrane protein YqgA involved in biofilm formation
VNVNKAKTIITMTVVMTTIIGAVVGLCVWLVMTINRDDSSLEQKACTSGKMVHHFRLDGETTDRVICKGSDGNLVLHSVP